MKSFGNSTMRSSNGFSATSPFSTPFYLVEDKTNKYRINENLKKTINDKNMIPFLRTNDEEYN